MPWNYVPYNELKKYFKIEFALRERHVDEDGDYTGYTMQEKKYASRECNENDYIEQGLSGTDWADYICIDWEGDEDKLYLMNSNEAAWNGGHNATNIIMSIGMCDDHTGEFEDEN